jgi:hypothetical protein
MNACCGLPLIWLTIHSFAYAQDRSPALEAPKHGFRVEVSLSEKAMKKLNESKETVIAIAYFTGAARAGIPFRQYKQYASRPGPIGLGETEIEVLPGKAADFSDLKLNQGALPLLDGSGPQLLINVVSGRKSSENNLLNCDIYEGPLKSVVGTSIPIHCKLISGE